MSEFIKVTSTNDDSQMLISASSITNVSSNDDGGSCIEFCDHFFNAKESIDQIEAQLLRDEFAMSIASGLSADEGYRIDSIARMSYRIADQMLKERSK